MSRVMSNYMRVGDGDGESKTRPHPAPLPCLVFNASQFFMRAY